MRQRLSADAWLALLFLLFALILVFIWIPLDSGTGLFEKVRRKLIIGDALGPTVSGVVIALGAIMVLIRPAAHEKINQKNLSWILALFALFAVSLLIMRYAGPLSGLLTESGYRALRATPPWNYIGFLTGGTLLVGGLTGLSTRRLRLQDFIVGFAATLLIALFYDLPFDDLILPPNGDV